MRVEFKETGRGTKLDTIDNDKQFGCYELYNFLIIQVSCDFVSTFFKKKFLEVFFFLFFIFLKLFIFV